MCSAPLTFLFMPNLSLTDVARGPVRIKDSIPADDPIWNEAEFSLREPLALDLEARSVGEGVYVRGRMRTRLQLSCRRCIEPLDLPVDEEVDLYYEPLEGREAEEWGGDVYPLPARATEVDLTPALYEHMVLNVPIFVVCREECKGLCAQCGGNLNETSCDCTPEEAEGPWDALKKLKFD